MSNATVEQLAKHIISVTKSDRDFPMVVSGTPGEGKSTFTAQLSKAGDPRFAFTRNFIFARKRWEEQLNSLPPYSFLISDESSNVAHKRDWMTEAQKRIIRILDMCRDRNLVLIFVLPNLWSLDSEILRRMKAWVFIGVRGTAHIFKPNYDNPYCKDPWYRKENEKKLSKWNPTSAPFGARGYCDTIEYEDLSPSEWVEYKKVKEDGRKQALAENKIRDVAKLRAMALYHDKGFYYGLKYSKKNNLLKHGSIKKMAEIEDISQDAMGKRIGNARSITQLMKDEEFEAIGNGKTRTGKQ